MFTIFPNIVMSGPETMSLNHHPGGWVRHICEDGTMIRVSTNTSFGVTFLIVRDGVQTDVSFGRDGSTRILTERRNVRRPRRVRDGRWVNDGSGCVEFIPN